MPSQASSGYSGRLEKIEEFNLNNRWVKRGLSMVPVKFPAAWEGIQVLSLVNVHTDGSISIYHSGCEIGQGLDVKVAQVC
jgi:xanthine dehydrogenase/oxidase